MYSSLSVKLIFFIGVTVSFMDVLWGNQPHTTPRVEYTGACDAELLCKECLPRLPGDFNFIKNFMVDGQGGSREKVEYSYVLTRGTQYLVNLCAKDKTADGIVMSLFDANRNLIVTSRAGKQYVTALAYTCNATGTYYIRDTFDGSMSFCGGSTLSFKR